MIWIITIVKMIHKTFYSSKPIEKLINLSCFTRSSFQCPLYPKVSKIFHEVFIASLK